VRAKASVQYVDQNPVVVRDDDSDTWCDWWITEDQDRPLIAGYVAVGNPNADYTPTTYDDIRSGCWVQTDRLQDMKDDHVEASLCFPNVVPRFCGQTFLEGKDKALSLECVRSYNDWILDEWCGGDARGHLLPLTIIPLWDVDLAVAEFKRCAEKGTLAVAFSENPFQLGLPTIHSGYWDPFFHAVADANVMLAMHIGSSSKSPKTSPDAPHIITTCTHFSVTAGSVLDFIFSGTLDRIPGLKMFYAESQAGWMPYVFEQADWLWKRREGLTLGSPIPSPPSSYLANRIYTSIYSDGVCLRSRDEIGLEQICWETDYPHSVASYPDSAAIAAKYCGEAGLSNLEIRKVMRDNAIRAFGLDRVGLS
jgi:predicted TIM-barrel fold metal-dependent hydrolase